MSGDALRERLADIADRLPARSIRLGSAGALPKGYEGAYIPGPRDGLGERGDERRLTADLATGVAAYRALRERGGPALPDAGSPPPASAGGRRAR